MCLRSDISAEADAYVGRLTARTADLADVAVVVTRDRVADVAAPAVVVADQWGEVAHVATATRPEGLPDPDALLDEGRRAIPLLPGVAYHFVSATVTQDPEHPFGRLIGDMLVRVPSASGPDVGEARTETHFAIETQRFGGVMHHQMQNHPAVYAVVRDALSRTTT